MASINLTDELVILLIFLNNEHFANAVTVLSSSRIPATEDLSDEKHSL